MKRARKCLPEYAAVPYCKVACIAEPLNENKYTNILLYINNYFK